jgi:hypothetical protein
MIEIGVILSSSFQHDDVNDLQYRTARDRREERSGLVLEKV